MAHLVWPLDSTDDLCTFTWGFILGELGLLFGELSFEVKKWACADSFRLGLWQMGHWRQLVTLFLCDRVYIYHAASPCLEDNFSLIKTLKTHYLVLYQSGIHATDTQGRQKMRWLWNLVWGPNFMSKAIRTLEIWFSKFHWKRKRIKIRKILLPEF